MTKQTALTLGFVNVPLEHPAFARRSSRSDEARRIRDIIRTRLLQGDFDDGRLPGEAQLMAEYGAGRNVIRAALALLQSEGLIARTQGVGTMSLTQKTRLALRNADGLVPAVGSPVRVVTRAMSVATQPAPRVVARRLDVAPGVACLAVEVITYIDGEPAVLLTSYVADVEACGRMSVMLGAGGWLGDWYQLLADADLRPLHRETVTEAVCLDDVVAPLLAVPAGVPAMRVERRLMLGEDRVPEFGYSYSRSDLIVFETVDGRLASEVSA